MCSIGKAKPLFLDHVSALTPSKTSESYALGLGSMLKSTESHELCRLTRLG